MEIENLGFKLSENGSSFNSNNYCSPTTLLHNTIFLHSRDLQNISKKILFCPLSEYYRKGRLVLPKFVPLLILNFQILAIMKSCFINKSSFFFFIIPYWYNVTANHGRGVPGFASILYNTDKNWYPHIILINAEFSLIQRQPTMSCYMW